MKLANKANAILDEMKQKEIDKQAKKLLDFVMKFDPKERPKKIQLWLDSKDFSPEDAKKIQVAMDGMS